MPLLSSLQAFRGELCSRLCRETTVTGSLSSGFCPNNRYEQLYSALSGKAAVAPWHTLCKGLTSSTACYLSGNATQIFCRNWLWNRYCCKICGIPCLRNYCGNQFRLELQNWCRCNSMAWFRHQVSDGGNDWKSNVQMLSSQIHIPSMLASQLQWLYRTFISLGSNWLLYCTILWMVCRRSVIYLLGEAYPTLFFSDFFIC